MSKPPTDRFDEVEEARGRIGAHRAPMRRGGALKWLLAVLLGAAVLSGAGILAVALYNGTLDLDALGESPETALPEWDEYVIPVAEAEQDPEMPVTLLNGTETQGLATTVGTALSAEGWNIVVESTATVTDLSETTVYYNHLDAEAAARALAESLGTDAVQLATVYRGSPLTVVLGSDALN